MPLDYMEIVQDGIQESAMIPDFVSKLKAYLATPKADRKYAGLCDVLGITPDGFLGKQLAMIDTVEEQAAT